MKGAIEASAFGNEKESPEFSSLAKIPLNEIKSKPIFIKSTLR